jgi:hypothetical protein
MTAAKREFRNLFPKKHIPVILSSIREAAADLRKKTNRDREDWITRRLCRRLMRIPAFRDGPLDITLKPELIYGDDDKNTPEGELDLKVSCARGAEVYFALEAKRLRVSFDDGRLELGSCEYVDEGMTRFIIGKYARFMKASAMLGYVFDGDTDKARTDVDQTVQEKAAELHLKYPKKLTPSNILPDGLVDQTCHALNKRSFTIYHIFLAV